MSYLIRGAKTSDLDFLYSLSCQFPLLNLPSKKETLIKKIEVSIQSFKGQLPQKDSEYLFVLEDLKEHRLVGSSQLIALKGTPDNPKYFFKVSEKNFSSKSLNKTSHHQVLNWEERTSGITEVGGLLINKDYRGRKEKLGKQISFCRLLYISMFPDCFSDTLHVEFAPPHVEDNYHPFWTGLGKKFLDVSYEETESLRDQCKNFVPSLFPKTDIYVSLLDEKTQQVLAKVGDETVRAVEMLETAGFRYCNEIDLFDGGPHYKAEKKEVARLNQVHSFCYTPLIEGLESVDTWPKALLGCVHNGEFFASYQPYCVRENQIFVENSLRDLLKLCEGDTIFTFPL